MLSWQRAAHLAAVGQVGHEEVRAGRRQWQHVGTCAHALGGPGGPLCIQCREERGAWNPCVNIHTLKCS